MLSEDRHRVDFQKVMQVESIIMKQRARVEGAVDSFALAGSRVAIGSIEIVRHPFDVLWQRRIIIWLAAAMLATLNQNRVQQSESSKAGKTLPAIRASPAHGIKITDQTTHRAIQKCTQESHVEKMQPLPVHWECVHHINRED